MAFEKFLTRFHQIKGRGDPTKSRLFPFLQVVMAYRKNLTPTERDLDLIEGLLWRVKLIKKDYARNINKKYGSAFEILEDEIEAERQKLRQKPESKGAPKRQRGVTPARPRSPSLRPMEEKKREVKRVPSKQAGGRPPPTEAEQREAVKKIERAWIRRHRSRREEAAEKLQKAAEAAAALREIGYGLEWKPRHKGHRPVKRVQLRRTEHKGAEEKGEYYKHLEPNLIWEAVDPKHRAGRDLGAIYGVWLREEKILSFWDYLDKNYGERIYRVLYVEKENLPAYRVNIRREGLKRGRDWDSGHLYDTSQYLSASGAVITEGWGIYVQSMTREVYSGSALMKKNDDEKSGGYRPLLFTELKRDPRTNNIDFRGVTIVHHSSFLRGKPVRCAGEWMVKAGKLKSISMLTGHYKTPLPQFMKFLRYLQGQGVQFSDATVKWLWPDQADESISYYKAQDFVSATHIEYLCEPYKADGPLPAVEGPESQKYLSEPRLDSGDISRAPGSRIPPRIEVPDEFYPELTMSVCQDCLKKPMVCRCHLLRRK